MGGLVGWLVGWLVGGRGGLNLRTAFPKGALVAEKYVPLLGKKHIHRQVSCTQDHQGNQVHQDTRANNENRASREKKNRENILVSTPARGFKDIILCFVL